MKIQGRPQSFNFEPPNPDPMELGDLAVLGVEGLLKYGIPGTHPPSPELLSLLNGDVARNRLAENEPQNTAALRATSATGLVPGPLWGDESFTRDPATGKLVQGFDSDWLRQSLASDGSLAQPFRSVFQQHLATGNTSSNIEIGAPSSGRTAALKNVSNFASTALDPRVIDTIIAEAGNDRAGQRAVAAAIINRAKAQGKTPLQIVQQHGQFEGYSNPGKASVAAQKMPSVRANAERAFTQIATGTVPDPLNGGTDFRASSATGGLHAPHGTVTIGGNTFALGRAPSTGLEAIQAVAPVPHPSLPAQTTAYANLPATTPPPLPIPRPSNPAGIRSVEINPDGSLKAPDLRTASLQPFAGGLGVQPQGAGDFWGPDTGRWGPSSFANAFPAPAVPERAPSAPLVARNVHTVAIDPLTGNPAKSYDSIGAGPESWFPSVAAPTPPSPRQIAYNSTAGNVALPPGVVPASVSRDLAAIKAMQMNTSGSPDDRSSAPAAPRPVQPYIPGPSSPPKADSSRLPATSPSADPIEAYSGVPKLPAPIAAIDAATSKPSTAYTYRQMQVSNPAYEKYIASQNADDIGAGAGSFGNFQSSLASSRALIAPPKYITQSVRVPVPQPSIPLPRPRPTPPTQHGGLLGFLFPGTNQGAFSLMGQGVAGLLGGAPSVPSPAVGANFLSDRGVSTTGLTIGQQANELNKALAGGSRNPDGSRGFS